MNNNKFEHFPKLEEEEEFLIKNKNKIKEFNNELRTPEYVELLNRINNKDNLKRKDYLDNHEKHT